jgi:DNA-binding transcriptional MerR regulator
MGTYTIGEAAERSGFSASALRYYEDIGLVVPAARTEAGYRLYDDRGLARLAFIARAKQLGCSLEEITDLASIWDGERCGPVQRRFHELVTARIGDAERRLAELTALKAQLLEAAAQLAGPATDGPCDDGCACVSPTLLAGPAHAPVSAPIACTLDAAALPERLGAWEAVLATVTAREPIGEGGLRLTFGSGVDLGALTRLLQAEQRCCAFFAFRLSMDERGIGLEVDAPAAAGDLVSALFGAAP